MAQFKQWFTQDLTESIVVRHCESVMFTGDDNGAVVGVRLFDGGSAYSSSGTVSGAVKRSDGGLVALTGTLSGNAASVVIPAAALAYPGPIGVHVVLNQGGSVTTILKAIYSVDDNTGFPVDPGNIVPSYEELLSEIAAMRDATAVANNAINVANSAVATANEATRELNQALGQLDGKLLRLDLKKVNLPETSPNGTAGQILRTNGDGSTTWIDQGLPTDEQTAEAVNAWLNAHPDATTTVQDGSITLAKLSRETWYIIVPEMFGAVGDGLTDDTEAIQDAIDFAEQHHALLLFPSKIYRLKIQTAEGSDTTTTNGAIMPCALVVRSANIVFNNTTLTLDKHETGYYYNAILLEKAIGAELRGTCVIVGDRNKRTDDVGELGHGIAILGGNDISINGLTIRDFWGDGIYLNGVRESGVENIPTDVFIENVVCDNCRRNSVGVLAGENVLFNHCVFKNTHGTAPEGGIDVEASTDYLFPLHGIYVNDCVCQNNVGIGFGALTITDGDYVRFDNVYSDSAAYADIRSPNSRVEIQNCNISCSTRLDYSMFIAYADTTKNVNGSTVILSNTLIKGYGHRGDNVRSACRIDTAQGTITELNNVTMDMSNYIGQSSLGIHDSAFMAAESTIYNLHIKASIQGGSLYAVFLNTESGIITSVDSSVDIAMFGSSISNEAVSILPTRDHTGIAKLQWEETKQISDATVYLFGGHNQYELLDGAANVNVGYIKEGQTIRIKNSKSQQGCNIIGMDDFFVIRLGRVEHVYSIRPGETVEITYDPVVGRMVLKTVTNGLRYGGVGALASGQKYTYKFTGQTAIVFVVRNSVYGIFGVDGVFGTVASFIPAQNCTVTYADNTITVTNTSGGSMAAVFVLEAPSMLG